MVKTCFDLTFFCWLFFLFFFIKVKLPQAYENDNREYDDEKDGSQHDQNLNINKHVLIKLVM